MRKNTIYILFFMMLFFLEACSIKESGNRPNVLFILVDDLGFHDLGYTGSTFYETPNIDDLASKGVVFNNAYAASPVCSPSRAALLTGKSPARMNLTDYIPGNRHWGPHKEQKLASDPFSLNLNLEEITIAERFKEAGYKTMFAGKWHLSEEEEFYPEQHGFDLNFGGNKTGHPGGGYFSPYKNPQLEDGIEGEYLTDRLTDEVINFIKVNKDSTFFAYLSYYTVHLPEQGKPEKVEKYKEKAAKIYQDEEIFETEGKTFLKSRQNRPHYAAMVESMDENIGRLLKAVEKSGLADNTIIVFTSDNGGMSTSNTISNIPTTNAPLRSGKGYLYEGGIKEPLIIKWANKIGNGKQIDFPTIGTDLYPTLLDMAGLNLIPDQHQDGVSLKDVIEGEGIDDRPIFWHYPHYSGGLGGRPSGAVRLGDYKLIEFFEDGHVELYNLRNDISEAHDLSNELPEKTAALKKLLEGWRAEVNAKTPIDNPHFETN